MKFKEFLLEEQQDKCAQALIEIAALVEAYDTLDALNESVSDEMLEESVKGILHKAGVHVAKGTGLIEYIFKGAKGLGSLFIAAIKGDTDRVKELARSVKKADVLDFLLKLDQATLHAVTGPIHFIDAVTGYHIGADIASKIEGAGKVIKGAMDKAKEVIHKSIQNLKIRSKMLNNIDRINKLVPQTI